MSHTPAGRHLAVAALLAASAPQALALGLGEAQLRSALAEPLDLVIAITATPEEALGPECFHLASPEPRGVPAIAGAQFAIESGPRLRVRTSRPLNEPTMLLRLNAACPGGGLVTREYPLLLDPRPISAFAPTVSPSSAEARPIEAPRGETPHTAPAATASEAGTARLRALPGDTLMGIATAIYPKNRRAREAYLAALREANPPLAGLGPGEPIPPETAIDLPDLKAFAQRGARSPIAATPAPVRPASRASMAPPAPAPAGPAPAPRPPRVAREAPASGPAPAPRAPMPASTPRPREPAREPGGFVLRLSSPEVDLARSRGVDDRTRAQLRERLMLLDADDQVSALLQLRHNLKQLESRVSEMQLRLSGPLAVPPSPVPEKAAPAPSVAPKPDPPKVVAPAAPVPKAPEASRPEPVSPPSDSMPSWGLAGIAVVGLAIFAFLAIRRRSGPRASPAGLAPASDIARQAEATSPPDFDLSEPQPGVVMDSDAQLTTRIPGPDPELLRRRYLGERFPEIENGTLDIANPDSVVQGARLFYEDGSLPRAVELLQFAIEERPGEMKPWLALFEIFRLENLAGEFGTLASRFREHHGASDAWRKVQFIGREIDPQNPLYRDDTFNGLETIGHLQEARARAIAFDPLAENWLNAPMDFTSDALATELRRALLADAGLGESDLIPNPMPALKQVEMFTVA